MCRTSLTRVSSYKGSWCSHCLYNWTWQAVSDLERQPLLLTTIILSFYDIPRAALCNENLISSIFPFSTLKGKQLLPAPKWEFMWQKEVKGKLGRKWKPRDLDRATKYRSRRKRQKTRRAFKKTARGKLLPRLMICSSFSKLSLSSFCASGLFSRRALWERSTKVNDVR